MEEKINSTGLPEDEGFPSFWVQKGYTRRAGTLDFTASISPIKNRWKKNATHARNFLRGGSKGKIQSPATVQATRGKGELRHGGK